MKSGGSTVTARFTLLPPPPPLPFPLFVYSGVSNFFKHFFTPSQPVALQFGKYVKLHFDGVTVSLSDFPFL